jgi:hypothetical protein
MKQGAWDFTAAIREGTDRLVSKWQLGAEDISEREGESRDHKKDQGLKGTAEAKWPKGRCSRPSSRLGREWK